MDVTNCLGNPTYWAPTFDDGVSLHFVLDFMGSRECIPSNFWPHSTKTTSYKYATTLTNDQIVSEIVWTAKAIYSVTGVVPRYMRPPFGDIDNRVRGVLNALGLPAIIWNVDPSDAGLLQQNVGGVVETAKKWITQSNPNGVIPIEHDLYQYSAMAAQMVIDLVTQSAYEMVKMSQCLSNQNKGGPYITSGVFLTW